LLYAHWVNDNTPEGALALLLKDQNLGYTLQTLEPGFANYRPWLEDLIKGLREIVAAEAEDDAEGQPPKANGNAGTTANAS
jgi:hypothetical protein